MSERINYTDPPQVPRVAYKSDHLSALSWLTSTTIPIGGELIGWWEEIQDYAALLLTPKVDQLVRGHIDWSIDGSTVNHEITTPFIGAGAFCVPVQAEWARIRVTNLSPVPAQFSLLTLGKNQAASQFMIPIGAPIDPSFYASVVRQALPVALDAPTIAALAPATMLPGSSYRHLATAGTTLIKSGPGVLRSVICNNPTVAISTLKLFDSLTGTGALIADIRVPGATNPPMQMNYNLKFLTGLTVVQTGLNDFTLCYD